MEISARNQLKGQIESMKVGDIMAEIVIVLADGQKITSIITHDAVDQLHLKQGDRVAAIIKSTEVMIAKS